MQQKLLDFDKASREKDIRIDMLAQLRLKPGTHKLLLIFEELCEEAGFRPVRASVRFLSDSLNVSISTARREIRRAEQCGLLNVSRTGNCESVYSLNWRVIFDLYHPPAKMIVPPCQNDSPPCQNERAPVQNDTPIKINNKYKNKIYKGASSKRRSRRGGWPIEIEKKSLRTASTVQRLYEHAVSRGWVKDCESSRLGFFTCAVQSAQKSSAEDGGAAPLFTWLVKRKAWRNEGEVSAKSEDIARNMLRILDGAETRVHSHIPDEAVDIEREKIKLFDKFSKK